MEDRSLKIINRETFKEFHFQLLPTANETVETFCKKIFDFVDENKANIVRATFFGPVSKKAKVLFELEKVMSEISFPFTWIEGGNCSDSFINGVYIYAISGLELKTLYKKDQVVGTFFQTRDADYCYLGGLYSDERLTRYEQTISILNLADEILNQVNLKYDNTVRTWFYLDEILEWYNDFNKARTLFFNQHDIFNKLVPASTGISGKNEKHSAIALEINAVKPKNAYFSIERISSPLQCSAENYGSSFSRAIMFYNNEYSFMTISGTASINEKGETVYKNDIKKQIEQSFKVLMAIIDSKKFKPEDIVRAYAYCKDKKYYQSFTEFISSQCQIPIPIICSENNICRADLLFEIEVDLVQNKYD